MKTCTIHGIGLAQHFVKIHTCSKVILCIRLFTVNLISRKDSKTNKVCIICKHVQFIFLQKDSRPGSEVWPPLGNQKKENT